MTSRPFFHFVWGTCLYLIAACFASRTCIAQSRDVPEPTHKDVSYGPHERHVLDFWRAESSQLTPFVVFIHGGGFSGGSKEGIDPVAVRKFLNEGISVVSVNYRYHHQAPLPAALHDCRRALQFVRSKSDEWNLDKPRAGAFGGSAGAVASMYLAFHDEMANPQSPDLVARESTRLMCVATKNGQTTLDIQWWAENIPGWPSSTVRTARRDHHRWGCSEADFPALIAECSALSLISADDPPIWMKYGMSPDACVPSDPETARGWRIHHVAFGIALKASMDNLGIEAHLQHARSGSGEYATMADFFCDKLQPPTQ